MSDKDDGPPAAVIGCVLFVLGWAALMSVAVCGGLSWRLLKWVWGF